MSRLAVTAVPSSGAARSLAWNLASLLEPRRVKAAVVVLCVIAAASFELVPPLVIKVIVDDHLLVGRSAGLLVLALFYLGASAAVQTMTFVYSYLAATIAQSALSELRVRVFAHLQRLPIGQIDRMPLGDLISRCTADVEALDAVFSSGVAVLVA